MAELKDKIKTTLAEGRMLILGSQVLLGFQFRSVFEKGFEQLPEHAQYLKLAGLVLMLVAVALLMWPGAYHQIVEGGEDTHALHHFATRVMGVALLPFALGLGVDFFVATEHLAGRTPSLLAGVAATLAALFWWYGLEALHKRRRAGEIKERKALSHKKGRPQGGGAKTKDKIDQVLTEIRVVLPGAQALLGFQFATMLTEGFEKLPTSSKYVHLASLALIASCIVLMMTPAAYHRIVEEGEETEHFCRFASRVMLASMVPLALGINGDLFVVVRKITESVAAGLAAAALALLFFYGIWFGFTLYRKRARPRERNRPPLRAGASQFSG